MRPDCVGPGQRGTATVNARAGDRRGDAGLPRSASRAAASASVSPVGRAFVEVAGLAACQQATVNARAGDRRGDAGLPRSASRAAASASVSPVGQCQPGEGAAAGGRASVVDGAVPSVGPGQTQRCLRNEVQHHLAADRGDPVSAWRRGRRRRPGQRSRRGCAISRTGADPAMSDCRCCSYPH